MDKKYISKIIKGTDTLFVKDLEAQASIETINTNIQNIQTSVTGGMHYIGETSTTLVDGATTSTLVAKSENSLSKLSGFEAGDIVIYDNKEFIWNGAKWNEFGSTGSLKALAFADSATGTVAAQDAAVSFSNTQNADFVTGIDSAAVAPSFTEGAFTPASIGAGFYTAGSAATYSHSGFEGGSLAEATKGSFNTDAEKSSYDEATETLTLSAATTAQAVTAQGTFTPAVYGTDSFNGGAPTEIDVTKFNGGSKAADTFKAGSAATFATAKAITNLGSASAAVAQQSVTVSVNA